MCCPRHTGRVSVISATTVAHEQGGSDQPVVDAITHAAPRTALGELIAATLTSGWRAHGLPADRIAGILAAVSRCGDSDSALAAVAEQVPELSQPIFAECYSRARAAKFDTFAALLDADVRAGYVVDVGAGDRQLLHRLAAGKAGTWVATDVAGEDIDDGGVSFRRQTSPDRLPVPDGSATTVIATGMLHHVPKAIRRRLLGAFHRALTRGGRLVIVEDTFPDADWEPRNPWDARFADLGSADRMRLLAWTDWWGNRVLKGRPREPLPCTFLTMSGWERTLSDAGFEPLAAEYLGLDHLGGHMATPRARLVMERAG